MRLIGNHFHGSTARSKKHKADRRKSKTMKRKAGSGIEIGFPTPPERSVVVPVRLVYLGNKPTSDVDQQIRGQSGGRFRRTLPILERSRTDHTSHAASGPRQLSALSGHRKRTGWKTTLSGILTVRLRALFPVLTHRRRSTYSLGKWGKHPNRARQESRLSSNCLKMSETTAQPNPRSSTVETEHTK